MRSPARPLSAKLGLKSGDTCWTFGMPVPVVEELAEALAGMISLKKPESGLRFAHIFHKERAELEPHLVMLRNLLDPAGMIWVSWPKKAAKVPTTITEDVVRELCLPMGLVDVKVCAVDKTWSGLKLVLRKEIRPDQAEAIKNAG